MDQTNWILTLTRNCLPLTMKAVQTFLAQDIGNIRVLLLDNGSDSTSVWARQQKGVRAFTNRPPKSVAESWNCGLRTLFLFEGAERVLVVNNDTQLRPETYRVLDTYQDGTPGFITAIGDSDLERALGPRTETEYQSRPHPDFSCYLIRKWVWDKVGPFNEAYLGAFGEDCEYHVRMHRAGVRAICIDLPFLHVGAGSQTVKTSSHSDALAIREQAHKNRELFKRTYGCLPGDADYEKLFGDDTFGIEKGVGQ